MSPAPHAHKISIAAAATLLLVGGSALCTLALRGQAAVERVEGASASAAVAARQRMAVVPAADTPVVVATVRPGPDGPGGAQPWVRWSYIP